MTEFTPSVMAAGLGAGSGALLATALGFTSSQLALSFRARTEEFLARAELAGFPRSEAEARLRQVTGEASASGAAVSDPWAVAMNRLIDPGLDRYRDAAAQGCHAIGVTRPGAVDDAARALRRFAESCAVQDHRPWWGARAGPAVYRSVLGAFFSAWRTARTIRRASR